MDAKLAVIIVLNTILNFRGNYAHSMETEALHAVQKLEMTGNNIRLHCHLPKELPNAEIRWRFKKCGEYYETICETNVEENVIIKDNIQADMEMTEMGFWTPLYCKKYCKKFIISNANRQDSGLYQCFIQSRDEDNAHYDIHILKTYEIAVIDTQGSYPEILNENSNITTNLFEKVTFTCKVYSKQAATILWLKQTNHTDVKALTNPTDYGNYEPLKSSGVVLFGTNIYLSKLIIQRPTFSDIGIYNCIAINYIGFTNKTIYLDVIDKSNYRNQTYTSMYLLFLMPLGLLILPLSIWFFYFYKRNSNKKTNISTINVENCNISDSEQSVKNSKIDVHMRQPKGQHKQYRPLTLL